MKLLSGSASRRSELTFCKRPAASSLRSRLLTVLVLGCLALCSTSLPGVFSQPLPSCNGAPNADTCPCVVFIPPDNQSQPTNNGRQNPCVNNGGPNQLYFTCYDWQKLRQLLLANSVNCAARATVLFASQDYHIEQVLFATGQGYVDFVGGTVGPTRLVAGMNDTGQDGSFEGQPGALLSLQGFSMIVSQGSHSFSYVAISGSTEWQIDAPAGSEVISVTFNGGELNDACFITVLPGFSSLRVHDSVLGGGNSLALSGPRVRFTDGDSLVGQFAGVTIYSSEQSRGIEVGEGAQLSFSGCTFVSGSPDAIVIHILATGALSTSTVIVQDGSIAYGPSFLFRQTNTGNPSFALRGSSLIESGISVAGGTLTVSFSTLDGQRNFPKGLQATADCQVQVSTSTITGYTLVGMQFENGPSVQIDTSTIHNNIVGISLNSVTSVSAAFTTIVGNSDVGLALGSSTGPATLYANLISNNGGPSCAGNFNSLGGNVVQTYSGLACQLGDDDFYATGPPEAFAIGPLQNNGGPTPTMVPASTSKAISFVACPGGIDQRGVPRNQEFCNAGAVETAIDGGGLDPHFELPSLLLSNNLDATSFSFDFHGEAGSSYCMISDDALAINTHMVGLSPDVQVVQRPVDEQESFFEGTWMDGLGFLYLDSNGHQQNITVSLAQPADEFSNNPFTVTFGSDTLSIAKAETWTSPDEKASIELLAGRSSTLLVSLKGLLDMEISRGFEEDIIVEPPVQFLNLEIRGMTHSANVNGFLGQMYQPGAAERRLAMGTLEGLLHREYIEGTDEEYLTSSLTDANCNFNRFKKAAEALPKLSKTAVRKLLTGGSRLASSRCLVSGKGGIIRCK